MKFRRVAGATMAGLLLVGCGTQLVDKPGGPSDKGPMDAKRFYQVLGEEECPPEPCTRCLAIGAGSEVLAVSFTDVNFILVEGQPGNFVTVNQTSPLGTFAFVSTSVDLVNCRTESGRDIVRAQGRATATRLAPPGQITGTFVLEASVIAGSVMIVPLVSYAFTGDGDPTFNTSFTMSATTTSFTTMIVDTDAPCPEPE